MRCGPLGFSLSLTAASIGGNVAVAAPSALLLSTNELQDDTDGAFATILMVGGVEPGTFSIEDGPSWLSVTGNSVEADGTQGAGPVDVTFSVEDGLGRVFIAEPVTLSVSATPIENGSGIGEGDGDIIIPDPEDPETDEDGYEEPPVQHDTSEGLKITGKNGGTASWFKSLPLPVAGEVVTFAYEADWSGMNMQGRDAAIGFVFKNGNDYHLTGLRGNGSDPTTMLASRAYGDFRKSNSFTLTNDGAAADTVKNGPNFVQVMVSDDGETYSLYAGDTIETLALIQSDRLPAPLSQVDVAGEFGIGGYFSHRDKGVFSITITTFDTALVPPMGFIFLVDGDGAYLIDGDGAVLMEPV